MADGDGPSATSVVSVLVASVLLLVFTITVIWTLSKTLDPPLQADPAPETPPRLLCVQTSEPAETEQPDTSPQSTTPGQRRSPDSPRDQERRQRNRATTPSGGQLLSVQCPDGQVELAPQTRGAYDPAERLIGLLAIVVPLITTIVAFFFGARAGAGEGRSEAARARQSKAELANRVRDNDEDLYQSLKQEGRI